MLGLGFSIGVHAAGLVLILHLATYSASRAVSEEPFVIVQLVQLTENGGEKGEPPAGSGHEGALQQAEADVQHAESPVVQSHPVLEKIVKAPVKIEKKIRKFFKRHKPVHLSEKAAPRQEPQAAEEVEMMDSALSPSGDPSENSQAAAAGENGSADSQGQNGSGPGTGSGSGAGGGLSGSGSGSCGPGGGSGGGTGAEFGLKQVDQPPVPVKKVDPEFPSEARKLGVSGKVVLKFLVKADGTVILPSVLESRPEGLFDQSAIDAILRWRFTPGIYRGNAVATWVIQPVNYRLTR